MGEKKKKGGRGENGIWSVRSKSGSVRPDNLKSILMNIINIVIEIKEVMI